MKLDQLKRLLEARNPVVIQDTPYAILFLRKATMKISYSLGEENPKK